MAENNLPEIRLPTIQDNLPEIELPEISLPGQEPEDDSFLGTLADVGGQTVDRAGRVIADIGRGVGAGIVNVPTGILQTGAIGIDAVFDTNSARAVGNAGDYVKDKLGLEPTGTAGEVAEGITTFASAFIPVAGWLGRASSVARGDKVLKGSGLFTRSAEAFGRGAGKNILKTRTGQAVTTTLAAGASDAFVAPDGTKTVSDHFDALPEMLNTESDSGLMGRDEAGRIFRNKIRVAVEGTAAAGAFEAAFPVLRGFSYAGGQVLGATLPKTNISVASVLSKGFDVLGENLQKIPKVKEWFTTAGLVPDDIAEDIIATGALRDEVTDAASKYFANFEKAIKRTVKGQGLLKRNKEGIQKAMNDLNQYLEGSLPREAFEKEYDATVVKAADDMRGQIDGMTDLLAAQVKAAMDEGKIDERTGLSILEEFEGNKLKYIRRVYEIHTNPNKIIDPKVLESAEYSKSVQEVAEAMKRFDNHAAKKGTLKETEVRDADTLASDAKLFVNQQLGINSISNAIEIDAKQTARMSKQSAGVSKDLKAGRVPLYAFSENLFKARSNLLDQAPTLRGLMGEIKDPKMRYLKTLGDMASGFASKTLYKNLDSKHTVELERAAEIINAGGRPMIVDSADGNALKQFADRYGYKQLAFDTDSMFGGKFGDLAGKAVSPELYNALTGVARNPGILNDLWATSLLAKGLSQISKTVLNPIAQVRNFNSGAFMLAAIGGTARNTPLMESMRLTLGKAANLSDAEFKEMYDLMGQAGIRDQNVMVNEFQKLIQEGSTAKYAGPLATKVQTFMDSAPIVSSMQKMYANTDTFWKVAGYFAEKAKYASALKKSGINPNLDNELGAFLKQNFVDQGIAARTSGLELEGKQSMGFLDLFATDNVKRMMPTYSRVPEAIKAIRRIPVAGNFVAFPAEILRNSANILNQSLKEMSFKVTDDMVNAITKDIIDEAAAQGRQVAPQAARQQAVRQANKLAREIRAIGGQRVMSYGAAAYATPLALETAATEVLDITPEQMEALKKGLPDFLKGHTILPMSQPKDGKMEYVDFSYMNPYDFMKAPFATAQQIYSERGQLSDNEVENILLSAWAGLSTFAEPFASESLVAERLQNVLPTSYFGRGGKTQTGSEIYDESMSWEERWSRGVNHVLGGFNPGIVELFTRERAGEFRPGRIGQIITGTPGPRGEVTLPEEEGIALVTGFRRMEFDAKKQLGFTGGEYNALRSQAVGNFNNVAKRNDVTEEDIVKAYTQFNNDLKRAQSRLHDLAQSAIALGISEEEVINVLKNEANLGNRDIYAAISGEFSPIQPSSDTMETILIESQIKKEPRIATDFPLERVMELMFDRTGESLSAADQKPEISLPEITLPGQAPQIELPEIGLPTTAPATPPSNLGAPQQAPDTSLLGSNPIDILKNLQIFQRQQ